LGVTRQKPPPKTTGGGIYVYRKPQTTFSSQKPIL
jgi:hypothetical protein